VLVAARFALEGCGSAGYDLAGTAGWVQVGYGGPRWGVVCFVRAGQVWFV